MPKGELYDIGEDRRDCCEPVSAPGSKRYYPGMTINDTVLPMLKDIPTGQTIKFEGELKVTGSRIPEDYDTIQKGNYISIDVIKIGEPSESEKA